jgi:H+/Cl- antiporter ClcA
MPIDPTTLTVRIARTTALGVVVGVLAGISSAVFLRTLDVVTEVRLTHPWLLYLLPLGGFAVGLAYHRLGGRSSGGAAMILDEIHQPTAWLPRRMAAFVYVGTEVTHLLGGSAGREGTALQMSGSLTDAVSRRLSLPPPERRVLLVASLAGGFGAVFGVPFAGVVFGLEVQPGGRLRWRALLPAIAASFVGDRVVRLLGVPHETMRHLHDVDLDPALLAKVAIAGVACGLAARAFVVLAHALKHLGARHLPFAPARPFVGGIAIIGLVAVLGTRDYLGLSLPLGEQALLGGAGIVGTAFAWKLVFTAITLGSGFQGGEVTPLFVIGATLGVTLGRALDVPVSLLAAVCFVAVFAGAARVPLACTAMAVELFGWEVLPLAALACAASWFVAHPHGIYGERLGVAADGVHAPGIAPS